MIFSILTAHTNGHCKVHMHIIKSRKSALQTSHELGDIAMHSQGASMLLCSTHVPMVCPQTLHPKTLMRTTTLLNSSTWNHSFTYSFNKESYNIGSTRK